LSNCEVCSQGPKASESTSLLRIHLSTAQQKRIGEKHGNCNAVVPDFIERSPRLWHWRIFAVYSICTTRLYNICQHRNATVSFAAVSCKVQSRPPCSKSSEHRPGGKNHGETRGLFCIDIGLSHSAFHLYINSESNFWLKFNSRSTEPILQWQWVCRTKMIWDRAPFFKHIFVVL